MSDTTRAFDGKADAYGRNRFDYSPQAIDAIVAIAGLDKTSAIADLGAGTGMLSRHFADRVGQVFAIEPNDEMRALALSSLGPIDSVHLMKGTADDTGLPSRSVHAVTAGRAIQWFDPAPSQAEILRILRPGGWLIIVRTPPRDPYSTAALERLRDECGGRHAGYRGHHPPQVDDSAHFGSDDFIHLTFPCAVRETWPQFIGRMRSLSFSPQPGDSGYRAFESVAREIFDQGAAEGILPIQYATEVLMKEMGLKATPQR
jgi:SAM-dependent methyltransferase